MKKKKETNADEWKEKLFELNSPLKVANGFVSRCTLPSIVIPRMCAHLDGTTTTAIGDSDVPLIYQDSIKAVTGGMSDRINRNREYLVFVPIVYCLY